MNRSKIYFYISLAIVYFTYYFQIRLNLFTCDDFRYALNQINYRQIKSFHDILVSQWHAYLHENGRYIVHCIVQYFASFGGMELFRLINSFIFTLLVYGISNLVSLGSQKDNRITQIPIICAFLFIFLPIPGCTILGNIACSVNYLWASSLYVWFTYIFLNNKTNRLAKSSFLLCALSFVAGAFQESFSIGISCSLFIYLIIDRKHINVNKCIMAVSFWLGSCFLCLAPGNFDRASQLSNSELSAIIHRSASIFIYAPIFTILLIISLYTIFLRRSIFTSAIKKYYFFVIAALVNASFAGLITLTGLHQLTSICLFSIIVILSAFFNLIQNKTAVKITSIFAFCIIAFFYLPVYRYRSNVQFAHNEMTTTNKGYLISEKYDKISYKKQNLLQRHFTTTENYNSFSLLAFSRCYNLTPPITLRLPQTKEYIVNLCKDSKNKVSPNVYRSANDVFYVIKASKCSMFDSLIIKSSLTTLKSIKHKILNLPPIITEIKYKKDLVAFADNDFNYYIVMDSEDTPIIEITVNNKK